MVRLEDAKDNDDERNASSAPERAPFPTVQYTGPTRAQARARADRPSSSADERSQ